MRIGMIGMGRMGLSMACRLLKVQHECVVHDLSATAVNEAAAAGAVVATSLPDLVAKVATPRRLWLMLPAAVVQQTVDELLPLLNKGDIVVDGGNSHYRDDIDRAKAFAARGVRYLDVGVSGGIWGSARGYCLMIGGADDAVAALEPIFKALAPGTAAAARTPGRSQQPSASEQGYLHCGASGAGHFVKMVHNGIEYGLMASYAEGLNILRHANAGKAGRVEDAETAPLKNPELYQFDFNLAEVAEVWRRGSVISSWLLDVTAHALLSDHDLKGLAGRVSDSGEGRWTLQAAIDESVPAPILSIALSERLASRGEQQFADKVLSAMRHEFGGHVEKRP